MDIYIKGPPEGKKAMVFFAPFPASVLARTCTPALHIPQHMFL